MHSVRRGAAILEPVVALAVAASTAFWWIGAERGLWWWPGAVVLGALTAVAVAGLFGLRSAVVVLLRAGLAITILAVSSVVVTDPGLLPAVWCGMVALVYPLVLPTRLAIPAVLATAAAFTWLVTDAEIAEPLAAVAGAGLIVAVGMGASLSARLGDEPVPDEAAAPKRAAAEPSLAVAFDTAAGGLALLDADARIVRANQALADLMGRSPEGLAGASWWGQVGPEDVEPQQERFAQLLDGRIWSFHIEARLRTRDRRLVWTLLGMSMVAGAAGQPDRVFVQVANIDERVHRELGLRERVAGSRRSFERAPTPIWEVGLGEIEPALERWRRDRITDLTAHLEGHPDVLRHTVATLEIRDVNDAAKALVGADGHEEFVRGVHGGRLGPGFERALAGQLGALWRGRASDVRQAELQDFEGGSHPGLLHTTVVEDGASDDGGVMMVAFTELADLLQRQAAIGAVETRLHSVVAATPVVLFATDASGLLTLFEGRALSELGLAPGEIVGRSIFEVYREVPEVVDAMRRALDGDAIAAPAEIEGRSFDIRYMPVFEKGRVEGVIGLAVDVTDRPPSGGVVLQQAQHALEAEGETAAENAEQSVPDDPAGPGLEELDAVVGMLSSTELEDEPVEIEFGTDASDLRHEEEAASPADEIEGSDDDDGMAALSELLAAIEADETQVETPDVDPFAGLVDLDEGLAGPVDPTGSAERAGDDVPAGDDVAADEPAGSDEPHAVHALDLWDQVDAALAAGPPGKAVATNRDGSMAKVFGTEGVIRQALGVLLANADRHGGPRLTVRVDRLGDELALSVIDDGPGLPDVVRAGAFGPDAESATGALGEARRAVGEIGGDLTYDYRQGHSVFALTLPAV
jgi:PAS domain S-box-containing protein